MTGCRQEPRLAEIGRVRGLPRFGQRPVGRGQLAGARDDAAFQALVQFGQRFGPLHPLGCVGDGGDHAPVRHRVAAQFQNAPR